MSIKQGSASYPPIVKQAKILGYVAETNGIFHSRDIGRGFSLSGNVYLMFGDTFCNDSNGEFMGLVNNTVAIMEDFKQPLRSKYVEYGDNGLVKPFLPLTPEEVALEMDGKGRVALWVFGGVIEMEDGTGRLWYQKSIDHFNGFVEYIGTGVAKVLETYGVEQQLAVERMDGLVFGAYEPRMGTFSVIAKDEFIYLYGDRPDGRIILARVDMGHNDDPLGKKEAYYYWDGENWVQDWKKAKVVIEGMQQGAIVHSRIFGEDRPYLFVGTSKTADSQVYMGVSAKLEGPWEIKAVCKAEGIKEPTKEGKWMYCIYPQLWFSNENAAELLLTWSEQYPGGVVAAKISLRRLNTILA